MTGYMLSHRQLTWDRRLVFFQSDHENKGESLGRFLMNFWIISENVCLRGTGNPFVCCLKLVCDLTLMPSYFMFNIGLGADGQTRQWNSYLCCLSLRQMENESLPTPCYIIHPIERLTVLVKCAPCRGTADTGPIGESWFPSDTARLCTRKQLYAKY